MSRVLYTVIAASFVLLVAVLFVFGPADLPGLGGVGVGQGLLNTLIALLAGFLGGILAAQLRPRERPSAEELEKRVEDVEKRFDGKDKIPVPEFWGGLRVVPEVVEFWQGRPSRLHDRFRYTWVEKEGGEGEWKVDRLSP